MFRQKGVILFFYLWNWNNFSKNEKKKERISLNACIRETNNAFQHWEDFRILFTSQGRSEGSGSLCWRLFFYHFLACSILLFTYDVPLICNWVLASVYISKNYRKVNNSQLKFYTIFSITKWNLNILEINCVGNWCGNFIAKGMLPSERWDKYFFRP